MIFKFKNWFYPCGFIGFKILYDNYHQEQNYFKEGTNNLRHFSENFIVKADFAPTYPLPENAEYANKLSCTKPEKRRRLFVAHMYNGASKKMIDAHKEYLTKFKIDPNADIVYCPASTHLGYVRKTYPKCVDLGVQNIYPRDEGNFTGEISIPMAKDLGATYVLINSGHRRMFLGETDKFVVAKLRKVLSSDMKAIIFISNLTGDCDECTTDLSINKQMDAILPAINIDEWDKVVFAFESPKCDDSETHSPESILAAQKFCKLVRSKIANKVGDDVAQNLRVLYAGEMCHGMAPMYIAQEDIDGIVFCPRYESECFINIINSGLLVDKREEKMNANK